jgi:hypothetical protein
MSDRKEKPHKHSFFCQVQPMILVILILGGFAITALVCVTVLILKGVTGEKNGITEAMLLALYASPITGALGALGAILAVNKTTAAPGPSGAPAVEVVNEKPIPVQDQHDLET